MRIVPLLLLLVAVVAVSSASQLPNAGVTLSAPATIESATADYFELAHFDTSNRADGLIVEIWWNSYRTNADGTRTLVRNHGPVALSGTDLLATAADAFARAKLHEAAGRSAGLAYMLGQRDAIYAALQAKGAIPK